MKQLIQNLCPPLLWNFLGKIRRYTSEAKFKRLVGRDGGQSSQELDVYWDPKMAQMLEEWGKGTVWEEIQYFMVNCKGRVLDIACGTGKMMEINSKFPNITLYGCDISDFLLKKAVERGISEKQLLACDASNMPYETDFFDYAYSIGSLEHFTEEGIANFLKECRRTVKNASFHMVPVSDDGKDHGWVNLYQSYHNNSVEWWLGKYNSVFDTVYVFNSAWRGGGQLGKWFVCVRDINE